ncbi:MAG: AI-2E family transporter [Clostridia bacterium]|nr:AI-2E family transporter [Clostridia bacterium]
MNKLRSLFDKRWFFCFTVGAAVVLFYLLFEHFPAVKSALSSVWSFLSPVVLGVIVAYLFNPVSEFFKRKWFKKVKKEGTRHALGVIMTIICFLLVLILILSAFIPSLVKTVTNLVSNWDTYEKTVMGLLTKAGDLAARFKINVDLTNITAIVDDSFAKLFDLVKSNASKLLSVAGSVGSGISNFAVGVLFGFCFLFAKKQLVGFILMLRSALIRKERIERSDELLGRCHRVFIRYIGCTLIDALIVGVVTLLFTVISKTPYSPLISVIVAITNIIPTVGPMIGAAISIFFIILESPIKALIFFIFICILQGLDGMVIKPRLFKGSLGISAVWTMILLILGGKIAGMLGVILSIPFAAIFVIIYEEIVLPVLNRRKEKINGEAVDLLPSEEKPDPE